jgi:hypothetical protein
MASKSILIKSLAPILLLGMASSVSASTLTLDFDISFGDPSDLDTAAPSGPAPWLTATFDDGDSPGSVSLTLSVSGDVGIADVTRVYLNIEDVSAITDITNTGGQAESSVNWMSDEYKAGNDGLFDILITFDNNTFSAGESSVFDITGTGLVASSFNFWSTPDGSEIDPSGPFLGAAKFQSTGDGSQSDWVGAVPVPAAVWLFGSGLLGLIGVARRRK